MNRRRIGLGVLDFGEGAAGGSPIDRDASPFASFVKASGGTTTGTVDGSTAGSDSPGTPDAATATSGPTLGKAPTAIGATAGATAGASSGSNEKTSPLAIAAIALGAALLVGGALYYSSRRNHS